MAAGLVFGLLAGVFKYPFEVAAYGAAITVAISYFVHVWVYCRIRPRVNVIEERAASDIDRRWYLLETALASVFALAILPTSRVDAAVIDQRLRKISGDRPLSTARAREASETLGLATKEQILIAPTVKISVRDNISAAALQNPNPPFTDAANALVKYTRAVEIPPAMQAMAKAIGHDVKAFQTLPSGKISINHQELEAVIYELTKTIELSSGSPTLRWYAYMMRASRYYLQGEPDKALADVTMAEALGASDLSGIVYIRASALNQRALREPASEQRIKDLKQSIDLFTLALELLPPQWIVDPANTEMTVQRYRAALHSERAMAYFDLLQFELAIRDSRKALELESSDPIAFDTWSSLTMIISAYLYLGDIREAVNTTNEWERTTHDQRAMQLRQLIESDPSEALRFLHDMTQAKCPYPSCS
jgi:tetratricopeptide (TPR) repeat protein